MSAGNIRALAGLFAALALTGCTPNLAPGHPVPKNSYAYQFEEYWYKFERLYPYFEYKHVNWQAEYDDYRPLADKVTSETQLINLLMRMATPLRDVHVWFKSPDGQYLNTYDSKRADNPNWSPGPLSVYVPDLAYYGGADWGFGHVQGFPYIFIGDWEKTALSLDDFAAALEQFESSPGLILDVRMNSGGNDHLAYKIAGYFADRSHLSEYYRYRNGPRPGDLGPPKPRYVTPAIGVHYPGLVMLLIGPDSFSSTENFIAAMQTLPNVTTLGATTGGASGCPETFALGDGWIYSVPVCFDMTADHHVIEWNGIQPEVLVTATRADFEHGDDPVLDAAVQLLKAKLKAQHQPPPSGR
ncbi:MAG: S41 family peptidase [Gammaproteobacteria bacterium]